MTLYGLPVQHSTNLAIHMVKLVRVVDISEMSSVDIILTATTTVHSCSNRIDLVAQ
jgi:hypothetical protein